MFAITGRPEGYMLLGIMAAIGIPVFWWDRHVQRQLRTRRESLITETERTLHSAGAVLEALDAYLVADASDEDACAAAWDNLVRVRITEAQSVTAKD